MIRISYIVKAIQWQMRGIKQFTQENIAEGSGSAIERLRAFRYGFLLETMQICGITKNNKNHICK